jgi:hypothetical protein
MATLAEDLAHLRGAVAAVAARDLTEVGGPEAAEAHREVRAACDVALAFAARLLARVEEDGRWASSGARSFPEWTARQRGVGLGAARAEVALGKALVDHLPATGDAVARGEITLEHAQVLTRLGPTSEARRAALASDAPGVNEASLVARARQLGADDFRLEMKRWAIAVDEAAAEREHTAAACKEYVTLARRTDGVALQGFLTVEHADVVATALRAVTGVPARDDPRTPEQRRAEALTGIARLVLDKGLSGGGGQVRPHISVHVPWDTFQRLAERSGGIGNEAREVAGDGSRDGTSGRTGTTVHAPAELDDGEPIPPSVLARIACDSEVTRVVFGPAGEPLDVGRRQRTFCGAQRHAVVARDRTCRFPGCDRPPAVGEVHHVAWWVRDGGPTAVDNGVLLCWYHHDLVHRWRLAITAESGRSWEFRRPDGSLVRGPGAPPERSEGASSSPPDAPPGAPGAPPGAPGAPGTPSALQDELPLAG